MSGIKLLDETEGVGLAAAKGDVVVYNLRIFLSGGDEVPLKERQAEHLPENMIRTVNGHRLTDHRLKLGSREAIAGVEYALEGMKPGGYRKVRISPHLGYRDKGLPGLIPAQAVLIVELWRRA